MNASNVRTSSTPAASSSLRPRNRRLISGLDEGDEANFDFTTAPVTRIASPLPSPFESRSASPIPASHLPRPTSGHGAHGSGGVSSSLGRAAGSRQRKAGNESPSSLAGLWGNSWSTLQGIASDLLSGDAAADIKDKPARARRPMSKQRGERPSTSAPPSKWGPAAPTSHPTTSGIGAGTREEQVAAFRAQKRKDMLTRQESSYADTLGKFKRRLSDDYASVSAPPGEHEDRDALVYVHHVRKDDTLAGITIKYNCSANILRKANRMWPNDTVQTRQAIVLPVDACGVKGKPVPGKQAIDLLSTDSDALAAGQAEEVVPPDLQLSNGNALSRNRTNSASTDASRRPSSSAVASSLGTEAPWDHDSWVLLPGAEKPTEIARLSRRALGYFPPARRKSNCYSDFNTPSTSLDLTRELTNEVSATSPSPQRPQRTRRLSNANNGYFPSYLAGPGGVGTMNGNVRFPGPAQDGLNKMFAKHLPDVAPPRTQQSLLTPEFPQYNDDDVTPITSGATTPNLGKNLNIENVGGAIEGWMRRMATNAKSAAKPVDRAGRAARASVGTPGKGAGGIGDLIEMTDEFEIGGDDEDDDEDDGRGRKASIVHVGPSSSSSTGYLDGAGVRDRSGRGGKSGKAD